MRILIVEDHPDILAKLYGFLEPKGHQLDSENDCDVIVLDVMLPGLNGSALSSWRRCLSSHWKNALARVLPGAAPPDWPS